MSGRCHWPTMDPQRLIDRGVVSANIGIMNVAIDQAFSEREADEGEFDEDVLCSCFE